jgi:formate-dependent phosphoribosylglycinamide formyltransferase (GAR transformylase)
MRESMPGLRAGRFDQANAQRKRTAYVALVPARPRPCIVLLSGHELNAGMVDVARRRGARLVVVDWGAAPAVRGDLHIRADIKDHDLVRELIAGAVPNLAFAYTSSDAATETAAVLHAERGLLRPPGTALERARHKPTMQSRWREAGLLARRTSVVADAAALEAFVRQIAGAVVVKPAAASSSRGVTILTKADGDVAFIAAAFDRAARIDPQHEVLAEEHVAGVEFSVEMLGDSAGHVQVLGIARKHPARHVERNAIAAKLHYNPAGLSAPAQAALAAVARGCYRALGLHSSLGHFEAIVREDGWIEPIELGARSAGFIFTHLIDSALARGPRFATRYEAVLHGGAVGDELLRPRRSSMYFFYDLPPGVGRVSGTSLAEALPAGIETLASGRGRLVAGARFGRVDAEGDRPGFEVLAGSRETLTLAAIERAEEEHRRRFIGERDRRPGSMVIAG